MTKGAIIFGLAVGFTIGLFVPRIFGSDGIGIANLITGIIGGIVGLLAIGAIVHFYGRIQ